MLLIYNMLTKSITGYLLNIYRLFLLQLVCDINALFISQQLISGHLLKIKLYQEDLGSAQSEEINFNHVQLRFSFAFIFVELNERGN